MTALQARLVAGRAVRDARDQERFARELRPAPVLPAQRQTDQDRDGAQDTSGDMTGDQAVAAEVR